MPKEAMSSDQRSEVNCRPWSVVMSCGTPKRETQWRSRACAQSTAVAETKGTASSHREKRSMIVRMYVHPSDSGSGPTRSRWRLRNRSSGSGRWTRGERTWRMILDVWQGWQDRAKARQSEDIRDHTNLARTSRSVALPPPCESPWKNLRTAGTRRRGTTGR